MSRPTPGSGRSASGTALVVWTDATGADPLGVALVLGAVLLVQRGCDPAVEPDGMAEGSESEVARPSDALQCLNGSVG